MTISSWPFRDAIVAVRDLKLDDFSRIEGTNAEELALFDETMKACSVFLCTLKRLDPKSWEAVIQNIKKNNL